MSTEDEGAGGTALAGAEPRPDSMPSRREVVAAFDVLARLLVHPRPPAGPAHGDGPEPWLTITDGAKHASVSEGTVREWIRRGLLPAGHCGNVLRVRRSDIDALLFSGKAGDRSIEKADPVPEQAGARPSPRVAAVVASLARSKEN